jgi:hypothetical protein
MLPISTSRPPRRRQCNAASVARLADHVERHVGAAAAGLAERAGVFLHIALQYGRCNARTAGARHRFERACVAAGRNDAARPHRDRDQHRRRAIGAGCSVHDQRLAGREPAPEQTAIRDDAAADGDQLGGLDVVQALRGRDRLHRHQRVFGERAIRPVRQNRRRVRTRRQPDQDLRRILDILRYDEMRRQHHPLARLQMPDVPANGFDDSDAIGADRERAGRRIVGGQFSLDIGLDVRHQRRGLDPHQCAARTRLRRAQIIETKLSTEPVQLPGLHAHLP